LTAGAFCVAAVSPAAHGRERHALPSVDLLNGITAVQDNPVSPVLDGFLSVTFLQFA